jgi:predicted transcriptional regulator of viral defense system
MANKKTLGHISAHLISTLYEENKSIFGISDAQRILGKAYNETTDLLSELVKRNVITRLKAGKFLIMEGRAISWKLVCSWQRSGQF